MEEERLTIRDKARLLAAKLTERIATSIIKPPRRPLNEHMLVIVSTWRAEDESVVMNAVEKNKEKAQSDEPPSMASKMFFGLLRFMGFGHIESTGEGDVTVKKVEGKEDHWVITTMVGVRVEDSDKLAATLLTLHERSKKLPNGIVSALIGVKPGKAQLIDLQADMT